MKQAVHLSPFSPESVAKPEDDSLISLGSVSGQDAQVLPPLRQQVASSSGGCAICPPALAEQEGYHFVAMSVHHEARACVIHNGEGGGKRVRMVAEEPMVRRDEICYMLYVAFQQRDRLEVRVINEVSPREQWK